MSLRPDDRSGRARSSSKSGRERSRSRSNVRVPEAPEVPRGNYTYKPTPSPTMPGSFSAGDSEPRYDERTPSQAGSAYYPPTTAAPQSQYMPPSGLPYPIEGGYSDFPPHERPGYNPRQAQAYFPPPPQQAQRHVDDDLAYGSDSPKASKVSREALSRHGSYTSQYRYNPTDAKNPAQQYQYAQAPEKLTYNARPQSISGPQPINHSPVTQGLPPRQVSFSSTPHGQPYDPSTRAYGHPAYDPSLGNAQVVEMTPGSVKQDSGRSTSTKTHRLSVDTEQSGLAAPRSPGLWPRMNRLSVSGNRPDAHATGGGMPPPSPMLEAYHGTWQSLSPMPLALRFDDDSELDDIPRLSSSNSKILSSKGHQRHESKSHVSRDKKRAVIYDGEEDANAIAKALNHHTIDAQTICDILPGLSHDQILDVRKEYKKHVKVQGKGVNLSKHIKTKVTGNFGKAVYVTALGRWESEGYWANFWYQSHGSRRELLIESLMGRSNSEIRMIKDDFKDKRYANSLTRCMEKELKMDKFRNAVLMVLEERRQEEQDVYPMEYVHRDVDLLYRSIRAERGGESGMLEIIVRRSDAHLREVLKTYEKMYGENFARVALKKSNNLVGEVIAHILNGVINKPARDALLLQHAIKDIAERNKDDELRYELLISRLVRLHWDKLHMMRVKKEYYEKYRVVLEDAIEDATKGDFREFMCELCEVK